jgi:hypothetical protein
MWQRYGLFIMRYKPLVLGFLVGLVPFVAANIYGYHKLGLAGGGACSDCFFSFGFPFPIWIEGGFVGVAHVLWGGLIADTSIAVGAGVILGLAFWKMSVSRRRLR